MLIGSEQSSGSITVVCVPHAGAGAGSLAAFRAAAPRSWSVSAMMFPGREMRLQEPPHERLSSMAQELVEELAPLVGRGPTVVVGQCSGALVAWEAARLAVDRGWTSTFDLVAASSLPPPTTPIGVFLPPDDRALVETFADRSGIPREYLDMPEFVDLVAPPLRSDYKAIGSYCAEPQRLPIRLLTISAVDDSSAPPEQVYGWSGYATETTHLTIATGEHLLLSSTPARVVEGIQAWLRDSRVHNRT